MKKYTILLILWGAGMSSAMAQPYNNAVGVRAGFSSGLIYKHFYDIENAVELEALYNPRGFQVSGLYVYQYTPYGKKKLYFFFGAGVHGGNWNENLSVGVAGLAGTEYCPWKAPVTFGVEWKPMFNIYQDLELLLPDLAFTFTVVIN